MDLVNILGPLVSAALVFGVPAWWLVQRRRRSEPPVPTDAQPQEWWRS